MQIVLCAKKAIPENLYVFLCINFKTQTYKIYHSKFLEDRNGVVKIGITDLDKLVKKLKEEKGWVCER